MLGRVLMWGSHINEIDGKITLWYYYYNTVYAFKLCLLQSAFLSQSTFYLSLQPIVCVLHWRFSIWFPAKWKWSLNIFLHLLTKLHRPSKNIQFDSITMASGSTDPGSICITFSCLASLLPERTSVNHGFGLRSGSISQVTNINRLQRTDRFITFKYT